MRVILVLLSLSQIAFAQGRIGTGKVVELFNKTCASCHNTDLSGGLGGELRQGPWKQVSDDASMAEYIRRGNIEQGMPAFGEGLSDEEIQSLVIYIKEMRAIFAQEGTPPREAVDSIVKSKEHGFKLETVVEGLEAEVWSIAFLPNGDFFLTERSGNLRLVENGQAQKPIKNTPQVFAQGQGGLLEVALHPDYINNGWIYLSYAKESPAKEKQSMTAVARGKIVNNKWTQHEQLFEAPEEYTFKAGVHFGSRFVFKDGYLYFSIGDRGNMHMAQDNATPNGAVHRIHDDGRIPQDNPFIGSGWPTLWTYGNRNPQGLDLHPVTGDIWESEHGPRGGDEINIIERGKNYGWPAISYGINYNGQPITALTEKEGMEQPKHFWTPSIAVCGIDFYEGDLFPKWKNNLFAAGLRSQELHRFVIQGQEIVEKELVFKATGRIRDIASGPDGALYLIFNRPSSVVKLLPLTQ